MSVAEFRVSDRGQMALPAEARRRWHLKYGGSVEVADPVMHCSSSLPAGAGCARCFAKRSKRPADTPGWPTKWRLKTLISRSRDRGCHH